MSVLSGRKRDGSTGRGARLTGANLYEADLTGAEIEGKNPFDSADLTGVNVYGTLGLA